MENSIPQSHLLPRSVIKIPFVVLCILNSLSTTVSLNWTVGTGYSWYQEQSIAPPTLIKSMDPSLRLTWTFCEWQNVGLFSNLISSPLSLISSLLSISILPTLSASTGWKAEPFQQPWTLLFYKETTLDITDRFVPGLWDLCTTQNQSQKNASSIKLHTTPGSTTSMPSKFQFTENCRITYSKLCNGIILIHSDRFLSSLLSPKSLSVWLLSLTYSCLYLLIVSSSVWLVI